MGLGDERGESQERKLELRWGCAIEEWCGNLVQRKLPAIYKGDPDEDCNGRYRLNWQSLVAR